MPISRTNYWQSLQIGSTYHIYNRAVGRDNLFINDENGKFFLRQWKKYLPYLEVYGYCLMPNHFHFLVGVQPLNAVLHTHIAEQTTQASQAFRAGDITYASYLEQQFKRLFASYALAFNKQNERHGALFQKRFKRIAITSEKRQRYLLAYIHHNPIHHGYCADYSEWNLSSYLAYQTSDKPTAIARNVVYRWFAKTDESKGKLHFDQYHHDFKIDRRMERDTLESA
ncbi:MAG: hypothetical protein AAGJ82_07480 [Bacteroidota bacterium]